MFPIHPLSQTLGLFGNDTGKLLHALHALCGKFIDAVMDYVRFDFEPQIFFGFDFHPQTLGIESVLILTAFTQHGIIADIHILHRPAPGMVNTHRVVGCDRAVQKAETFAVLVFLYQLFKTGVILPELQHLFFDFNEIGFGIFFSHAASLPYRARLVN